MKAVEKGNPEVVKFLLEQNVDSNRENEVAQVRPALEVACCICSISIVT